MDQASKTENDSSHEMWTSFTRSRFTSSSLAAGNPSYRIGHLDSELRAMERSVFLAKELRNEKLPINTLPAEVILEIFLYIRDDLVHRPLCWLRATTHTCRRFRSIALSSQALWTRFNNQDCSFNLIKSLVPRSGNHRTQLDVYTTGLKTKEDVVRTALDIELNRVETLLVAVMEKTHTSGEPINWLFSSVPMPLLRHLSAFDPHNKTGTWTSPTYIPHSLESLHVRRNTFNWTSALYNNLVDLRLIDLYDGPSQPLVAQFENLLSRMHRLASLSLSNVAFLDTPTESCINLPQSLKSLSVVESFTPISDFLAYAPHSALSKLTIRGRYASHDELNPLDVSNVLKHWSCIWNFNAEICMRLLLLAGEKERHCTITVVIHRSDPPLVMTNHPYLSYTQYTDVHFRIDESLAETCALVRKLRLAVHGYRAHEVTDDRWHSLLKSLTGLKILALTTSSLSTILPCLVDAPSYLPNLDVFRVVDETADEVTERGWTSKVDEVGRVHATWLSQWLSQRKKQGIDGPKHISLPPILSDHLPENM